MCENLRERLLFLFKVGSLENKSRVAWINQPKHMTLTCCTRRPSSSRQARRLRQHLVLGQDAVLDRHVADQVDQAGGVAPLVVVPRDNLDEGRRQHDRRAGIEVGGVGGATIGTPDSCAGSRLLLLRLEYLHHAESDN